MKLSICDGTGILRQRQQQAPFSVVPFSLKSIGEDNQADRLRRPRSVDVEESGLESALKSEVAVVKHLRVLPFAVEDRSSFEVLFGLRTPVRSIDYLAHAESIADEAQLGVS